MSQILSNVYLSTDWQPHTWFSALVLASLLDALTTVYALRSGSGKETNPVMRWAMERIGIIPALLVIKAIPLASLFTGLQYNILYVPLGVAVYVAAAAWNLSVIYKNKATP